jgi:pyruvate dehydrogenase E1 component
VRKAAQTLRDEFGCHVDVWSVTSFNELRREALSVSRSNMLNPTAKPKKPFVTEQLETQSGPVIATTDYMMSYADQVREFVPGTYRVLGTDGFGRSDSREVHCPRSAYGTARKGSDRRQADCRLHEETRHRFE